MGSGKTRENDRVSSAPAAFSLLPEGKSRLAAFLAGVALEFGIALLVMTIAAILPQPMVPPSRLSSIPLFTAPVTDWRLPAPKAPITLPRLLPVKAPVLPPRPAFEPRRVRVAEAPAVTPEFPAPAFRLPSLHPNDPPRPGIRTGVLPGSVARPTLPRAPAKVQTGGFGDPYGVPATGDARRLTTINPVGSFAMPVGPGVGNGTGGSHGTRGVIASAGFGNGIASPGEGGSARRPGGGGIRAGVFIDARAAVPATTAPAKPATPSIAPVEILEKPDPVYTAEARALKIEGDVVLDVIFSATGRLRVLRLVRGLGHGLDQAALAAAERIRFHPEQIDGRPVDSEARLRIVFRLAY
jgi:TonB family protein